MARLTLKGSSKYFSKTSAVLSAYPFTMAAWYRPTTSNATGTVVGVGNTTGATNYIALGVTSGAKPFIEVGTNSASDSIHGTSVTNGTWGHIAATVASSTSRIAWFNGVAATTATGAAAFPTLTRTTIGGCFIASATITSLSDGDIAEAAIWNVALSASDVASLSAGASPLAVRPDALVMYSPLIESSITADAFDLIGGTPLTQSASPAISTSHPPVTSPSPFKMPFSGAAPAPVVSGGASNLMFMGVG